MQCHSNTGAQKKIYSNLQSFSIRRLKKQNSFAKRNPKFSKKISFFFSISYTMRYSYLNACFAKIVSRHEKCSIKKNSWNASECIVQYVGFFFCHLNCSSKARNVGESFSVFPLNTLPSSIFKLKTFLTCFGTIN